MGRRQLTGIYEPMGSKAQLGMTSYTFPSSDPAALHDGPTWLMPIEKTLSYDRIHGGLQGSPAQPSLCPWLPHLPGEHSETPACVSVSMAMLTASYPKEMEFKVSSPLSISLVQKA